MSNLWVGRNVGQAAAVGSFAITRQAKIFRPWESNGHAPEPGNDESENAPVCAERMRADSYADGIAEGRRQAEAELEEARADLARLAGGLQALTPEPTNALALMLAETVDRLVREIVGAAPVDPMLLLERARAAAALIGEATAPARLRLHVDDIPLLDGADLPVALIADARLNRGDLVLETGQGWIEDGHTVRLDRLRAALDVLVASE